jgi:hypothetical protein
MLYKAHRIQDIRESYKLAGPILQTLTRDCDSLRVREIRANEDAVKSIYDTICDEETQFRFYNELREPVESIPKHVFYNEADALEDKILFAEEEVGPNLGLLAGEPKNSMTTLENQGPDMMRFVYDLDTDDELPDDDDDDDVEDPEHSCDDCSENSDDWEGDEMENSSADDDDIPASEDVKAFAQYVMRHSESSPNPNQNVEERLDQFFRREASRGICHIMLSMSRKRVT